MAKDKKRKHGSMLPKGLVLGEVKREPRWVDIWQADEEQPLFRVKVNFMSPRRHTSIYERANYAKLRNADDADSLRLAADVTFLEEYIADWEGLTIPNYNSIVFADKMIQRDPSDPDTYDMMIRDKVGLPYWQEEDGERLPNVELAHHIFLNSPFDRFQQPLIKEMTRFNDGIAAAAAEGKDS